MRFVIDFCGIACVFFTYFIVLFVDATFIYIGLEGEVSEGDLWSIIHLILMQFIVIMIIWSHLKCMLTDPGLLPLNYGN